MNKISRKVCGFGIFYVSLHVKSQDTDLHEDIILTKMP